MTDEAGGVQPPSDTRPAGLWQRVRRYMSLPELDSRVATIRNLFINGLFLVIIVVVVPVAIAQFQRDQVIIEPIAVPETLAEQGLTADVAANRVWDGLRDVSLAANTTKESVAATPQARQVEFSFPDSGFSIESLIFHLRRLFNVYDTRIAGEIVCADSACKREGLRLRLRIIRDHVDVIELDPLGARGDRAYFADAAADILAVLDPFVAIAAASSKEPTKATILARRLIRTKHPDAKWAYNLIGLIRYDAGENAAAIDEFRAALALDPGFLPARANLGNVLLHNGDIAGAKAAFDELKRRDPRSVRAVEGHADIALAASDREGAVKLLLQAAELDPQSPRYFARAGQIEMDAGNTDRAIELLNQALEIDPGYPLAFAILGAMYLGKEDYQSAEKIYRDAADYADDDAEAQASYGGILGVLKDWSKCAERYARAAALEPTNAKYRLDQARCLQRLGQPADALAVLDEAVRLAPLDAAIRMAMGDAYRDLGRKPEAIEAYKRFIELDPGSILRPLAEGFIRTLSEAS